MIIRDLGSGGWDPGPGIRGLGSGNRDLGAWDLGSGNPADRQGKIVLRDKRIIPNPTHHPSILLFHLYIFYEWNAGSGFRSPQFFSLKMNWPLATFWLPAEGYRLLKC